ncbi:hypothetical protein IV203_005894 [Nitzschia inconspicua]|uniref:Uncharacterized protein n=1 Tax=Nitzschia inconspicua TaxID=303405 RepID=A0A9K3PGY5_9STRA|nr:hypothetical protein IV203_005894 [Nitzschia inconspicua]
MMNIFSRKRALLKGDSRPAAAVVAPATSPTNGNVTGNFIDTSSVATDDSKSIHSQSMTITTEPSPDDIHRTEKKMKNNRQIVNKYVRKIGNQANLTGTLEMDSYGFCYIPFRRFLIILSVPADEPDQLCLNTMIFDLNGKDETRARKQVACLQHRQVHLGRRQSVVRLKGDEVYLYNCFPIRGLRYNEMVDILDDFMETALVVNADLTALSR